MCVELSYEQCVKSAVKNFMCANKLRRRWSSEPCPEVLQTKSSERPNFHGTSNISIAVRPEIYFADRPNFGHEFRKGERLTFPTFSRDRSIFQGHVVLRFVRSLTLVLSFVQIARNS